MRHSLLNRMKAMFAPTLPRSGPRAARSSSDASSQRLRIGFAFTSAGSILLSGAAAFSQDSQFFFDLNGDLQAQTVEVQAAPQILGQPQMQVVIPGESASFSVLVSDTSGLSYQWYFGSSAISGATSDALLITSVSTSNQGVYWVAVSNAVGSTASTLANLYIDSRGCGIPDSWQLQYFGNLNQNPLDDYDGDGVSNLQEFLDGTNPTNATSALYRISLVNDGGTVTVVPDQESYTNGQSVTLTATGTPDVPFRAWTGDVTTRSNSITLLMTANKSLFAHFVNPIRMEWTNTVSGDWNTPLSWTPNLTPGSNDSAVIVPNVTVTLDSNLDLTDLTLGSSQYGAGPTLVGAGTLTIHRTCLWVEGTLQGGRTVIAPGAALNIADPGLGAVELVDCTLENAGTAFFAGPGQLFMGGSAVITNDAEATFTMGSPNTFLYFVGPPGIPRFDNVGTFVTFTNGTTLVEAPFNNYGTVDIQGGTFSLGGGGLQAGAITVPAGAAINFYGGTFTSSGSPSLTGAGSLLVTGGTATLGGTVNVTGSNVFSGGIMDFTGNYVRTNTIVISGGTAEFDGTGPLAVPVLNLSGGALGGAQTVTVGSAMTWTGGSLIGTGRTIIPPGATLTISNSISITSHTLDNGGTTTWPGGNLNMNGGVITNEPGALFQVQSPGYIGFSGGSPRWDNAGTFIMTGNGTMAFAGVAFNNFNTVGLQGGTLYLEGGGGNTGSISVPGGTAINFGGGTFYSYSGSSITGAGNLLVSGGIQALSGVVNLTGSNIFSAGGTELNGAYTCTNNALTISGGTVNFDGSSLVSPSVISLSSGTLGGSNLVTASSAMSWTGGGMSGTGRTFIPPGVTLTISNSISITSRTLDNGGTTTWSGGNLNMSGGVITNEPGALFQVQSPGYIGFAGGSPRWDNAGTFIMTGNGTMAFAEVAFNNFNTVGIQGGTLYLEGGGNNTGSISVPGGTAINFGGGTFFSYSGSSITGAGSLLVSGGIQALSGVVNLTGSNIFSNGGTELNGAYTCTNNALTISGGTVNFDGSSLVSPSVINLSSGTLGGSNLVTVGSTMSWTGGGMSGTGRTFIPAAASLNINNPSGISITSRTLDNAGVTTWTGAGGLGMNGGIITNRPGALFNPQSSSFIEFEGGSPRFDNAGTFRKSVSAGTLTFASVSFTNYGTVDIQRGVLYANGSGYASSSNAVLNCALLGTTPGTNYGQLQVSGPVTLNGSLSVTLTNNYIPTTNDSFTVLTAGSRNGAFANFIYPSNKVSMILSNTSTSVIVRATNILAVPQPLLLPPQLAGSNVNLTWMAVSNTTYRVEFNPTLAPSNWNPIPGDVTALSNTASKSDLLTPSNRYYRVVVLP